MQNLRENSDFKVLLDVVSVSGATRGRRILPMMAVVVQMCNVFPGLRMGLDGVLAFQGQVLDFLSSIWNCRTALLLQADCLLSKRPCLCADALTLLLYYRFCYDIICFALMMRLKYHPVQFSVFYLFSIRDGAGQVKLSSILT